MSQSALSFLAEGDALFRVGRYAEAESCYRRGCALDDANADLWCNLGAATLRLGRYAAAREAFTRALEIQPDNTAALNNLAVLLGSMGQAEESLTRFQALAELAPDDPDVLGNIGSSLIKLKRFSEVRPWFERALALAPGHPAATQGLARVMQEYGEEESARSLVENFLANYPDTGIVHLIRTSMALPVFAATVEESQRADADFSEQLDRLIAWLGEKPRHEFGKLVGDSWPFELAYRPGNHRAVLSRWGDCMATQGKSYQAVLGNYPAQVTGRSRIRLAILCEQIRRHSVWDVILKGIVQHIDRQQFELVIYHTGRDTDQETAWAEAQVDRFVQGPKGHAEWLQVICADAPDVLLYPEIGMDNLTCKLATLRLAPLQVVSWGHPITTGLPDVDLFLSGELIEGPEAEAHYREKLIRLPGTGACTEMFACNPAPLPAELQALIPESSDVVKFLICQRPLKMDPADDALLAQIIATAQPCKLFLLRDLQYPWANERIRARLAAALRCEGVNPDEVLVELPWLAREHFFTLLDTMDVYLDMPSFSGYTTAWQAIHRGMPIVTLEGEYMRQRLAAGLLSRTGLNDTVAQTRDEYVAIAQRLAQECRDSQQRSIRRKAIAQAATLADQDVSVIRALEKCLVDGLAERGRRFAGDVSAHALPGAVPPAPTFSQDNEMSDQTSDTQATVLPWQMLEADLHLHTLTPNYAPAGLLEMMAVPEGLQRPFRVLDVGCFCGGSGRWIKQKYPNAEVIGIEMLEKAAEVAAQAYDRVIVGTFETVDFAKEGLAPGSVDAIVAADVLEHLYNPWAALQRLRPLLAPGGSIYISLPNIRNLNILIALAKGEWQYAGAGILDITHIRFFTRKQAVEMLSQTGWVTNEVRINPDQRLIPAFEGKDLSQITTIETGNLKLQGLTPDDVLELLALQLFIRATPVEEQS